MEEEKIITKDKQKKSKKRVWIVLIFLVIIAIYLFINLRGEYLNLLEIGSNYTEIFNKNLTFNISVLVINFICLYLFIYITNKFIKKGLKSFFVTNAKTS